MDKKILNYNDVINIYRNNPIAFLTDILDVKKEHVWDKMREVVESVKNNRRTAVKAAHSVSKTYTAARLALWYLYCFYPCTVVTSATTFTQVEQVLWRDIRLAHSCANFDLGGVPNTTKLDLQSFFSKVDNDGKKHKMEKWFAIGVSVRPDTVTQQATAIQGYHNEHVLVVLDEAAGIHKTIWDAVDSLIVDEKCKVLAIGNPTSSQGEFVNCFGSPDWNKITISVMDTPNYKEDKEVIPKLAGREFAEFIGRKYGEESAYYKSRVLGEIPTDDVDQLIPIASIERAEKRNKIHRYDRVKKYLVVDPADGGNDPSELVAWENLKMIKRQTLREIEVQNLVTPVLIMAKEYGCTAIIIDIDGIGRVLYKLLQSMADSKMQIIGFEGSSTNTVDKDTFKHRYSEGHWKMREAFVDNIIDILDDSSFVNEQREELKTVKINNEDPSQYIVIRQKKYDKEELGRSPGLKDTIMMACAEVDNVYYLSDVRKDEDDFDIVPNWRTA
jgi:hypothetical protein